MERSPYDVCRVTTYTFDARDRLAAVCESGAGVTDYTYDEARHLVRVTDPEGLVTEFLDLPGVRLVRRRDPVSGRLVHVHVAVPDRPVDCVTYTYDAGSLVVDVTGPDGDPG